MMERVIKAETDYEEKLQEELKTNNKSCEYGNCTNRATELFYASSCDLHFSFCDKCAKIIEAKGENVSGKLTIAVKTKRKSFELEVKKIQ